MRRFRPSPGRYLEGKEVPRVRNRETITRSRLVEAAMDLQVLGDDMIAQGRGLKARAQRICSMLELGTISGQGIA